MDPTKNIILIKGVNKTLQIDSINLQGHTYTIKFLNSGKEYSYNSKNVVWIKNPTEVDISEKHIILNGIRVIGIKSLLHFFNCGLSYYTIVYESKAVRQVKKSEIEIRTSCLCGKAVSVFDYLKCCSTINTLGAEEQSQYSKGILTSIYDKIDFLDDQTVASPYLHGAVAIERREPDYLIFPYGCNASQIRAVKLALSNQISVIQGPPGTGKTQTILNIISNLLLTGKSVLVVSNNNSATQNVMEKLEKNGFGFVAAFLGNRSNREFFVSNQPQLNPDLHKWGMSPAEYGIKLEESSENIRNVESLFDIQERLALLRQELAEICIEKTHFKNENVVRHTIKRPNLKSEQILRFLKKLKRYFDTTKDSRGLWRRIKEKINGFEIKYRLRFSYDIITDLSIGSISETITSIENLYYTNRINELQNEIDSLEAQLSCLDSKQIMTGLTECSMTIFKAAIAKSMTGGRRQFSSVKDIFDNGESFLKNYPVVLSTTFSSRLCFNSNTLFDYVIMDEASQISIETGFLALTCAKNAVIVGDKMQLPNVLTDDDRKKLEDINKSLNVPEAYDPTKHSFLSSIPAAIPNVPETLLREHYRCHPDIINFCNQKFYGGNLLIMTKREDGDKPLLAIKTVPGHHSRGLYNQREIDTVKIELLPKLEGKDDIGIIAPYNDQVDAFKSQLPEIDTATVHKFQGREKDTIILSVTNDTISEFADNPNLLNVAVSRAKKKFCLVVSGNTQELKGNIHDLINYIQYQKGEVIKGELRSIYDYLYTHISRRKPNIAISEFESENLTYSLIEKIQRCEPRLSHIKALCHYPMRSLIRDVSSLSGREKEYAMHPATHIDFLIINRVTKEPLLAIETDGYTYHKPDTDQYQRDRLKDHILGIYGIKLLRLSTVGHSEEDQIVAALLDMG
ncbi:MAG: AAA family ATPase [Bacteroides sp.]|nr:AAA family ATPase [Bacteroides sp.]